jgi:hypothetical protein
MPDAIAAAIAHAERPQHDGQGFTLHVTMTDGQKYHGAISLTPFQSIYQMELWDEADTDKMNVFINGTQAATVRIEW